MILEHYSNKPLAWPPRDYQQTHNKPGWGHPPKPEGLWVSVRGEDDWPSWCRSEGFRLKMLATCNRIVLTETANLKIVSGESQLRAFDEEYGVYWSYGGPDQYRPSGYHNRRIDWLRLANEYDGLIIAPYVWSCRLGEGDHQHARISDWYYGWDCASGCIWNGTNAIAAFETATEDV